MVNIPHGFYSLGQNRQLLLVSPQGRKKNLTTFFRKGAGGSFLGPTPHKLSKAEEVSCLFCSSFSLGWQFGVTFAHLFGYGALLGLVPFIGGDLVTNRVSGFKYAWPQSLNCPLNQLLVR